MKEKEEIPFHQYIISLLCVAFLAGSICYIYFNHRYQQVVAANSQTSGLKKVDNLYNEILKNYVGTVDEKKLIDGALQGMTDALDDPYTSYLNELDAENLTESITGSFEGIGATMSIVDNQPTISQSPVAGSPAEKSGLKVNDVIVKIDGNETEGKTLSEVVSEIRGEKGTNVKLLIKRGEDTFEVGVTRDTISVDSVVSEVDKDNPSIGRIEIASFNESTSSELKKNIEKLRKEGATSFVIDVRKNPGGLLDQVEKMASMFLEDGQTIVQFEDKEGNKDKVTASKQLDRGFKVTEPTVVLVDENSASASEIFAAALKESGGKKVIGSTTFGKGTVQVVKDLEDNSELKLSILKWLTPNGEWIHEKGLEPSIAIELPDYAYLDPISRDKDLTINSEDSSVIKNLNALLFALDYAEVDKNSETFSEQTEQAVRDIQKANNLAETGEVTDETATVIENQLIKKIKKNDRVYEAGIKEVKKE